VARYTGPTVKQSRREGFALTDKAQKYLDRRPYPPGEHGRGRIRQSEYLLQLREKQKTRRFYGLLEKQFRRYYEKANRQQGITGENLLRMLEMRLDNVVYRLGFGSSRDQARQLVRHGHVRVNEKRLNVPSFQVKEGDVIAVSPKAAKNVLVTASVEAVKGRGVPKWLELDAAGMKGKVLSMPARDDVNFPIQEQLIVELYSK